MADNLNENKASELDLASLIAEEKADKARQDGLIKESGKKERRLKKGVLIGAGSVTLALIVGLIIYDPFTQSLRWGQTAMVEAGPAGSSGGNSLVGDPYGWAKVSGEIFPEATKPWEETSYLRDSGVDNEERSAAYWDTSLRQAALQLPSEAAGFTSDDSKYLNDDETINPLYSYWTQEVFYNETTMLLERILNPIYGSWDTYQYSGSMNDDSYGVISNIFSDIIAPETLSNGSGIDSIPILADWNRDDYGLGDSLLTYDQGTRWKGKINSLETTMTYNPETSQYDVILVVNVTYQAWTKDKTSVTKDGTLTLNLGANNDSGTPGGKKVIVKSSSLVF